jgi:hypothetical protein
VGYAVWGRAITEVQRAITRRVRSILASTVYNNVYSSLALPLRRAGRAFNDDAEEYERDR